MIDIHNEKLISLKDVAHRLPRCPHIATVYRWVNRGVRGVRLEVAKIGGLSFTSDEALQRFSRRLTEQDGVEFSPDVGGKRRLTKAESELDRIGI
ncbi:MAG: DUF1580 domain-containing protein [Phycisphaerae bacterium]